MKEPSGVKSRPRHLPASQLITTVTTIYCQLPLCQALVGAFYKHWFAHSVLSNYPLRRVPSPAPLTDEKTSHLPRAVQPATGRAEVLNPGRWVPESALLTIWTCLSPVARCSYLRQPTAPADGPPVTHTIHTFLPSSPGRLYGW